MWCDETVRLRVLGLIPEDQKFRGNEATDVGTIMHQVLEESMGRRFPWEKAFMEQLKPFQDAELGFVRELDETKIYYNLTGHQDDIQITPARNVSLVEHKSTRNPNYWFINRFLFPMAQFQIQIYAWIMEPLIKQIGGLMNRVHSVIFWDSQTFEHRFTFNAIYHPTDVESRLARVIDVIEGRKPPIHPKAWKCKNCKPRFKNNPNHYKWTEKTGCKFCDRTGPAWSEK